MVGGIKYEHGHRMVAEFIGLLTIILAVWTWRVENRRWLRLLGLAALATVITQGILGGITVLFFLPAPISSAHAAVAQTFFSIAVSIAVFTGPRWVEEQPRAEFDQRRPALFTLTLLSIFVLYVQLVLGAMFRHHGMNWWPHVINAGVGAIVLSWTAVRAISVYSQVEAVRRPAIAMLGLMVAQLCLGFLAFITRVMWGRVAAQPEFRAVIPRVQTLLAKFSEDWPELNAALLHAVMDGAPGLGPQALARASGVLTEWRIVGPLGRHPLLDFDRLSISPNDDLTQASYDNRAVENFEFSDGIISLPPYLPTRGTFYAAGHFASLAAGAWSVRFESAGALEIYVDGKRLLRQDTSLRGTRVHGSE